MTILFLRSILELVILGIVMNWFIRGGGWRSAVYNNNPPFNIPGEDWINGAVYGAVFVVFSGMGWPFTILAGLCMVAGATPGISPEYTIGQMTLRGLWWGVCLAVPDAAAWMIGCGGSLAHAAAIVTAGSLMGCIYFGARWLFTKIPSNRVFNGWTVSEMTFGILLWICLILASHRSS